MALPVHRALLLLTLAVPLTACDVLGRACTTELRAAISGSVSDASGAPITPTRATASVNGQTLQCEIGDSYYICFEGSRGGEYALHVEAGGAAFDETFDLDHDGCHITESIEHDIVVP